MYIYECSTQFYCSEIKRFIPVGAQVQKFEDTDRLVITGLVDGVMEIVGSSVLPSSSRQKATAWFSTNCIAAYFTLVTQVEETGLHWVGNWVISTVYKTQDVVYYAGSSFVCETAHTASVLNRPPNPTNWSRMAASGDQGPPGEKYAIVETPAGSGSYHGLVTRESPEVLFDDNYSVQLHQPKEFVEIDSKFIGACEADSLKVTAVTCNEPINVGVSIENRCVKVKVREVDFVEGLVVNVTVTGTRYGRKGVRFTERSEEDAMRAQRHWDSLVGQS